MGISVCWWKRRLSSARRLGLCEWQKHPKRLSLGYGFDTLGIWIMFLLAYEFIWYHITPWSLLTDVDSCFAPGTTTKWFLRFAIAIEALFFSQLTRGEWYFDVTSNDLKWWCKVGETREIPASKSFRLYKLLISNQFDDILKHRNGDSPSLPLFVSESPSRDLRWLRKSQYPSHRVQLHWVSWWLIPKRFRTTVSGEASSAWKIAKHPIIEIYGK